ncbi:MAG: protein-L-isoaspartate O-methyltransferase [Rickettsiales bacterium]
MRKAQLLTNEVTNTRVLQAIADVSREQFVTDSLKGVAYVDEEIPLSSGRFVLEPLVFAKLLEMADIRPNENVLDIGCGLGYSAAVIGRLARHVTGVEMHQDLAQGARKRLSVADFENVDVIAAPLVQGCPQHQPFDVIFIEGAVEVIPDSLLAQLSPQGRLIAVGALERRPGSRSALGAILHIEKNSGNTVEHRGAHVAASLLPGFERAQTFRF